MAELDREDSERIERFVTEAIAENQVFILYGEGGHLYWKNPLSDGTAALGVWSGERSVQQLCDEEYSYEGYSARSISLFDFLYAWIPVAFNNNQAIGLNGNEQYLFTAIEPLELQQLIIERLPDSVLRPFEEQLQKDPNFHYSDIGAFQKVDAQTLMDAFEKEGIRFDASVDPYLMKGLQAILAGKERPASSGHAGVMHISVFEDDLERAEEILATVLNLDEGEDGGMLIIDDEVSFIDDELERLKYYCQHDPQLHFYIKYDTSSSCEWILAAADEIDFPKVKSFVVTYPSGTLLDSAHAVKPLPASMKVLDVDKGSHLPEVIRKEINSRNVKITHALCEVRPEDDNYYSTTLTNRCKERVRVLNLAFTTSNPKSILGFPSQKLDYLEAAYFNEAYGLSDAFGWIQPGEQVTHPYNRSERRGYWIYFFETENKQRFISISPKIGRDPSLM